MPLADVVHSHSPFLCGSKFAFLIPSAYPHFLTTFRRGHRLTITLTMEFTKMLPTFRRGHQFVVSLIAAGIIPRTAFRCLTQSPLSFTASFPVQSRVHRIGSFLAHTVSAGHPITWDTSPSPFEAAIGPWTEARKRSPPAAFAALSQYHHRNWNHVKPP